jgi:hypothetical protein
MELIVEPLVGERPFQRVDTIRDEQRRSFLPLREEVAHRPIERARHSHGDAVFRHDGKRSVDAADGRWIAGEHAQAGLVRRHVVDGIERRIEQIHQPIDVLEHRWILDQRLRQRPSSKQLVRMR